MLLLRDRRKHLASWKPRLAISKRALSQDRALLTMLSILYLDRIKAYNGVCVNQPQGTLGPISIIAHAGQLNALMTLNLRPETRKTLGFDDRKGRSMTDLVDNDPAMPDALEVAASMDLEF